MSSEKLIETFINAVVGFGSLDHGYSEAYCKEVLESLPTEGSEALAGIAERMILLLGESNEATTGGTRE